VKILHCIPSLDGGGAERQLLYLAPALARMGHEVHIAHTVRCDSDIRLADITLHYLKCTSNYDPSLLIHLLGLVRSVKPDVIHTWILQMDILGGLVARLTKTPWIIREPSSGMAYPPTLKNRLRVRVVSGASAIASNSACGDAYWASILPDIPRRIIRNGLPADNDSAADPAFFSKTVDPKVPIIAYVGRLVSDASGSKNLSCLLKALAVVSRKRQVQTMLCGEGPQRQELEMLRDELGLHAHVHFRGHLPSASVRALLKKASVFVSLSAFEGCPNTVMEAMQCECPVVISDIPAHREILDETSAIFVDPCDINQTAEAILQSLANGDAATNRAMKAKEKTLAWSIAEMAGRYEQLYEEIR
jgi:glycosyltransferase involved in cell wall biosynthesis